MGTKRGDLDADWDADVACILDLCRYIVSRRRRRGGTAAAHPAAAGEMERGGEEGGRRPSYGM